MVRLREVRQRTWRFNGRKRSVKSKGGRFNKKLGYGFWGRTQISGGRGGEQRTKMTMERS